MVRKSMRVSMKRQKGFTFIEVLVVLLIVSILASIAYPSYNSSVRKARRTDAKADIVRAQILQEKYRSNNASYADSVLTLGVDSSSTFYQLTSSFGVNTATTYSVTATALKDQVNDSENGVSCASLTLNVVSGVESYAPLECWKK